MRTVNSIADLRTQTGMTANELAIVLGYANPGDGGGGEFYWNPTSTANHNGGIFVAPSAGGNGRWIRIFDGPVHVKWFGAKGNAIYVNPADHIAYEHRTGPPENYQYSTPAQNDTSYIQAAYNYCASTLRSFSCDTLYFPSGSYLVDTLEFTRADVNIWIKGDGFSKTTLLANTAGSTILRIGTDKPADTYFSGRMNISGISIYGRGMASIGIDMINARYTIIESCQIWAMAENGTGIWTNHWVNRILNNQMFFGDTPGTVGIKVETGAPPDGSINGLNIMHNNINGAYIGVRLGGGVNLVNIDYNTLDQCFGAAIYTRGTKLLNISRNYIEGCGDVGIAVDKGNGSPVETWYGAIIGHGVPASPSGTFRGLRITNNQFANCSDPTKPVISLSSIIDCVIRENNGHLTYKNDSFVELRWEGAISTEVRQFIIDHAPASNDQYNQLVKFNTDNNLANCNNIIIRDHKTNAFTKQGNLPVFNNPMAWPSSSPWTSFTEDEPYEGYWMVNKIPGSTVTSNEKTLTLNLETDAASNLKGAYYRIFFRAKGAPAAPAGVLFRVFFDGVETYAFNFTSESWESVGRGMTFRIPPTCSELKFAIRKTTSGDTYLTQFAIVPAALPLEYPGALPATRLTNNLYRCAGTPEGSLAAPVGALAMREDGASGTALYVKVSGIGNTGWKPLITG